MPNGILMEGRRNNPRDSITGAPICRADLYPQLLDGPPATVEVAFAGAARDNRHLEVRRYFFTPVTERPWPNWAMLDDPARSWMWPPDEIDGGAVERASQAGLLAVFDRLAP